jgi:hypothetical protein
MDAKHEEMGVIKNVIVVINCSLEKLACQIRTFGGWNIPFWTEMYCIMSCQILWEASEMNWNVQDRSLSWIYSIYLQIFDV